MTNPKRIRLGVIGCGWIMRSMYVPALQSLAGEAQVVAVCDLNAELAAEVAGQFTNAIAFTDAERMLRETGLDTVLVLTTEKVNARMARMVMEANVPVFLEKPPAVSSIELEDLIAAEAKSSIKIYTAFNRRHTPLYSGRNLWTGGLKRISGALKRTDRKIATFPLTAIHVIDSAQYFAGSTFKTYKVDFKQSSESATWTVKGRFKNGMECLLEVMPYGKEFTESLTLEANEATWELSFPNTNAKVPEGEITLRPQDGSPPIVTQGEKTMPSFEAMGFRGCLQDFFRCLRGEENSAHRLASCRATIALMEEMVAKAEALG